MRALPYTVAWLIPLSAFAGMALGGGFTFLTVLLVFVLTPLLDLRAATENADAEEEEARRADWRFDGVLWGFIALEVALLVAALRHLVVAGPSPLETVGLLASVGLTAGAGINVAHELMHRPGKREKGLAELLLLLASYPHFSVEHVHGHHRHVATPLDPATSRLGESVYAFLPRSIFGGLRSFWRIETARVRKRGARGLADRRLRYPLEQGALYLAVLTSCGVPGLLFFLGQGLVGVLQLEVINYLEHYGLRRRELSAGRYERVRPEHSWSSPHRLTALYLFNLPRHADHHYLASRPYSILRHHDEGPQLPAGYAAMFLLALAPPVWRRVMDPRVRAVRGEAGQGGPVGISSPAAG